jgi:hypothetical protein
MYQYTDIKKYIFRRGHKRWEMYAKTLTEAKRKWSRLTGLRHRHPVRDYDEVFQT